MNDKLRREILVLMEPYVNPLNNRLVEAEYKIQHNDVVLNDKYDHVMEYIVDLLNKNRRLERRIEKLEALLKPTVTIYSSRDDCLKASDDRNNDLVKENAKLKQSLSITEKLCNQWMDAAVDLSKKLETAKPQPTARDRNGTELRVGDEVLWDSSLVPHTGTYKGVNHQNQTNILLVETRSRMGDSSSVDKWDAKFTVLYKRN